MMKRRRFFQTAAGLLVPAAVLGSAPLPLGFWKPSSIEVGTSAEPELSDWISRVQGQGSDTTTDERTMVGTFLIYLKDHNSLFSKAKRLQVYLGNAKEALKAPLLNLRGGTTDVLTGFVDANYTANGLIGGSGKRIDTGYNNTATGHDSNSFAVCVYNRTASNTAAIEMGSGSTGDANSTTALEISNGGTTYGFLGNQVNYANATDSNGTGFYVLSRVSSTDLRLFKNGSQLGSTVTTGGGSVTGFNIWVHDGNLSNSSWLPSARQLCFNGIFSGLTVSDVAALYTGVQALQTSRGRQV